MPEEKTKRCCACLIEKSIDNFYPEKHHSDGITSRCKPCLLEYKHKKEKEYRDKDPELYRKRKRVSEKKWRENNRDKYRAILRKASLKQNRKIKLGIVSSLGGRCACCGEVRIEFLSVDHINGGGNAHRRRVGTGYNLYREVKKEGFPLDKYRILCYNCNFSIGHLGYCPHDREKNKDDGN